MSRKEEARPLPKRTEVANAVGFIVGIMRQHQVGLEEIGNRTQGMMLKYNTKHY
jgi:hypothetical protein